MELDWIELTLEQKAAFRLLRGKQAGFALECMFQGFPTSETIERTRSDLLAIITARISARQAAGLEVPERRPEHILVYWSEHNPKWLTPRVGASGEMSYTLSPGARDAMQYLEQARVDARISTESLMTSLMSTIEDAASRLTGDKELRVSHLKARIEEIEAEILDLEANGMAPLSDDAVADVAARMLVDTGQILAQLRELPDMIATFRSQSEELTYTDTRPKSEVMNDLIGHHEELHATQAYRSMFAMSQLYSKTSMRTRFDSALEISLHAADAYLQTEQSKALRAFMPAFTRATNAIVDEERRVFEQQKDYLRRLESDESRREKRAAVALNRALVRLREELPFGPQNRALKDIRLSVSATRLDPPRKATMHLDVKMPDYPSASEIPAPLTSADLTDAARRVCAAVALGKASSTEYLLARVRDLVAQNGDTSLHDLLVLHPPRSGLKEVVQYLKIAASHLPACYSPGATFDITIPGRRPGSRMQLICPNPVFRQTGQPGEGLAEFVARTRIHAPGGDVPDVLLLPDIDIEQIESLSQ